MDTNYYYIAASYKSKWTYWNGNKFAQNLNEAKKYATKEVVDKIKASLQKLSPSLILKVEEVVIPSSRS